MAAPAQIEFRPIDLSLRDGRHVKLRVICAQDKEKLQAAVRGLSTASRYSRFMSALRELSPQTLERAANPEADRELQLVVVTGDGAQEEIVGGSRYVAAADSKDCEFAVTVVDDWQGLGIARQLLEALMQAARARGYERMEGYILASNARMLNLAKRLGFVDVESPEAPSVRLLKCDLANGA